MRLRQLVLGMLATGMLLVLGAAPAGAFEDFSGGAFNILAPGAEGGINSGKYSTDQGKLYDALTPRKGKVIQANIERNFLSEKFGVVGTPLRTELPPRSGLEIVRDKHDVPHIYGTTRGAAMYGSGWVAAKDRGLLLKLGLGPAYAAALSIPGVNPFGLLLSNRSFKPSAQAIAYVNNEKKTLEEKGAPGFQVIEDLENWVDGVNGYEATQPEKLKTVTFSDAVAGFAFISSIFGAGGGSEVRDSELLARLQAKFGEEGGKQVFKDLRQVNDPEAPTTTTKSFPYDQEPTGPTPGALVVEPGTQSPAAVKASESLTASRRKASNFLVVGAGDSASGHPLAVMGPQLGYYYPEIVFQADIHAPGLDAQGVVAPISPYVFIGRGRDFAWSLTSAGNENTQQFLEQLCNPGEEETPPTRSSTGYMHNGICVPMTTFDAGEIGALGAEPAHEVFFKETVHGPVSGTVLVNGAPYAIANDRADRGRDPAGEVAFSELDSNQVHNPTQFFEVANELDTTFNMSYLDSEHIAYFSTGLLPVLAPGTDPSLPTLGTGEYDWKGFLPLAAHPHEVDPASNTFINWNNKPAPDWGAASDEFSYGPIHRVQLFKGFKAGMTEADDASIMNKAATQDLRAITIWPTIERVLNTPGPAPSALAQEAVKEVRKWVKAGASRYGKEGPKKSAAAILDAAWTPIGEAVLSPVLGELTSYFKSIDGADNGPNSGGSSYGGGWYGYVDKGLRQVLGDTIAQPLSRGYCGAGNLEACRNSLWSAIQGAAEGLQSSQGGTPKTWKAAKVRISFAPGLPGYKYTMAWTNRSTFQQIIEFTGHAPE